MWIKPEFSMTPAADLCLCEHVWLALSVFQLPIYTIQISELQTCVVCFFNVYLVLYIYLLNIFIYYIYIIYLFIIFIFFVSFVLFAM